MGAGAGQIGYGRRRAVSGRNGCAARNALDPDVVSPTAAYPFADMRRVVRVSRRRGASRGSAAPTFRLGVDSAARTVSSTFGSALRSGRGIDRGNCRTDAGGAVATISRTFVAGVACCMVALGACGNLADGSSEPTQSARSTYPITPSVSGRAVLLDFDNEDPLATTAAERVSVRSLEVSGGQAVQVHSGNGTSALRFPAFSAEREAPRLVLVLNPIGASDLLNPGGQDFSFGADLRLNDASSGKGDDNGDNVLQRGLFSDANQYKLQVDKRVPSC